MAAYTIDQIEDICTRYRPAILRQVGRYHNRRVPIVSEEDLLQDAMEILVRHLRTSDTEERFCYPTFDIRTRMLKSIHDSLPLTYDNNRNRFAERLRQAEVACVLKDDAIEDDRQEDVTFRLDYEQFWQALSKKEQQIMTLVLGGETWGSAAKKIGLSRAMGYYIQERIQKKYNDMMR